MLADVVAAVGPDRGRHWMSGLPQNNYSSCITAEPGVQLCVAGPHQRRWPVMLEGWVQCRCRP